MNADTMPRAERGGVLIATVLLMLFLGSLTGTLLAVQMHRDRLKNQYSNKIVSLYTAEGGINYGVELIWAGYLGVGGGKPGKLADFRAYLNKNTILSIPEKTWVSVPLGTLKLASGLSDVVDVYRTDAETYTDLRFRSA